MLGCFHTVPIWGSTSPVRHLMRVDLPAPLGPRHATREEGELDGRALDDLAVGAGVGEVNVVRLDDGLVLVLHALEEAGDGEDELELVVGELGVLLRRRAWRMNSVRLPL